MSALLEKLIEKAELASKTLFYNYGVSELERLETIKIYTYFIQSVLLVILIYCSLLHNVKLKIIVHFILLLKKNSMEHCLQIYIQRKDFRSIKRSAMHVYEQKSIYLKYRRPWVQSSAL